MAVTRKTLTGDFANIIGDDFTAGDGKVKAFLSTNLSPGEALVDLAANKVQVGTRELTLSNGAFSVSLIATDSADTNIDDDSLRYRVTFTYVSPKGYGADPQRSTRETWDSDYFELTADADLSDVAGTIIAPISWRSAFITEMEALRDEAVTAAAAAVAYADGFDIGTVDTLDPGTPATAEIVDGLLNLGIPDGEQGPPGPGTGAGAWQAATAYTANQIVQAPDGQMVKRLTSGTSGGSYNATEQASWDYINAPAGNGHGIWYVDSQAGADDDAKFAAAAAKWAASDNGGEIVHSARTYNYANQWFGGVVPNDGGTIPRQKSLVVRGQGGSRTGASTPVASGTVINHTFNAPGAVAKLDSRGLGQIALRDFTWRDTSSIVRTVTNKALTSNVATLTVGPHTVQVGQSVVVAGVDSTFNGTVTVTAVSSTTISYAKTASNVSSTSASGTVTGGDHTPFVQITNTTPLIDGLLLWGEKSNESANQDGIILGGGTHVFDGTATGQFAGYQPIITNMGFRRMRRLMWARSAVNSGIFTNWNNGTDCGAIDNTYGGIQLDGLSDASIVGNMLAFMTLEASHYPVMIRVGNYAKLNYFIRIGIYDATATTECGIFFDDNATGNTVEQGYSDESFDYYRETVLSKKTNTFLTSSPGRSSVFPQPVVLSGGGVSVRANGVGVPAVATNGDRVYMRGSGGAAGSPSYPEAIITSSTAQLVTDLATTSGSNLVTSASGAFTAEQRHMPISGTGIPANTFILYVVNSTTLRLSDNATATATGVTAQIGRSPINTGGTAVDEIGFARRHIITKGAIGTAGKGAAAGGSASTVTATGTDTAFLIDLTTASSGTGTGTLCTVPFGVAFQSGRAVPQLTPMNAAAAEAMVTNRVYASVANNLFTLAAGAGTPAVSTQMLFAVMVIQA